jgi:micrococcal nuclease
VIDGDTIHYDGVKIRIADIDKPEIFSPKSDSELELDQNSKHRLLRLMNAGPFIIVQTGTLDEDVYGRELRVITYDARLVGERRIAEGVVRRRGWA